MNGNIPLLQMNGGPGSFHHIINSIVTEVDTNKQGDQNGHTNLFGRSYSDWNPELHGATLVWREVSVYAKHRQQKTFKRLVNSVSGAVRPGTLVALMGPSGAGKSTLMGALAYRNPTGYTMDGDILLNGRRIGPYMHRLSGFMHQEDLFVGCLTVEEHLQLMARLKMDRRIGPDGRARRVQELLQQMGLYGVRNTRIGLFGDDKLLSGGEKKRLAFATELLTNPMILFCDEPTTGLDSFSAQKLVKLMNKMAAQGRTIVCTIHQPSSELFAMFDQIILIADGRIGFSGTSKSAVQFFESQGYQCPKNFNTAEYFIRALAPTPGAEEASHLAVRRLCDQFAVSDAAKELDVTIQLEFHMMNSADESFVSRRNEFKQTFWWVKLYWLTYRGILQVARDPSVQAIRIFQKIAIAVMAGLCFVGTNPFTQSGIQSVQGALFILISENTFTPMYSTLALFPQEFPLFLREYKSGLYSISTYYVAKLISLLPGLIVEPIIFALIAYLLAGLRTTWYAFSMTMMIAVMVMNVAAACGCMFSCAFESVALGMAYLIPFDYTLMITSGLFVKLSSLPEYIGWVRYFSWLMYSNEAMTIVQWEGVTNITCDTSKPDLPCLRNGQDVLDTYSFSESNLGTDLMAMVALYLIFHFTAYIFLRIRAKTK
ncbi:ATP-binding cassette transporter scarlet [Arctopsyche grandis]|uniref:ATP-binding cassette transporter scarlet n=1 Tax=Arctopsyche grandis TaxID=121162 RepID=UPI00406DA2E5